MKQHRTPKRSAPLNASPVATTSSSTGAGSARSSQLLTMLEAANVLRFSLRKLQSMRAAGQIRVLVFGRSVRVEQSEADRLIEEARR